jgi:hypothetical protein
MSVSESGSRMNQAQEKMLVLLLLDEGMKESDMFKLLSLILTISRCLITSGQSIEDDQPAFHRLHSISQAFSKMRSLEVPTRPTLQIVAALGLPRPKPSGLARKSVVNPDGAFSGPRGGLAISHAGVLWLRKYESERLEQLPDLLNEDIVSGLIDLHITPTDVTFYGQQVQYRKSVSRLTSGPSFLSRPLMGDDPGDMPTSQPSFADMSESSIQQFPPDAFVQRLGNIIFKISVSDQALGSNQAGSSGSGVFLAGLCQAFIQKGNKSSSLAFTLQDCLVASEQYRIQDALEDALVEFRKKMGELITDPKSFMNQAPRALEAAQTMFLNRCVDISDVSSVRENYRTMKEQCDLEFQALVSHTSFHSPHKTTTHIHANNNNASTSISPPQQQAKHSSAANSKNFLPSLSTRTTKSRLGGEPSEGHLLHAEASEVSFHPQAQPSNASSAMKNPSIKRQSHQFSMDGSSGPDGLKRASRDGGGGTEGPRPAIPSLLDLVRDLAYKNHQPSQLLLPAISPSISGQPARKGRSKTMGGYHSYSGNEEEGQFEEVVDIFSFEKMRAKHKENISNTMATAAPVMVVREELVEREHLSKGTVGMIQKPFGSLPPVFDLPQHKRLTRREVRGKSCPAPSKGDEGSMDPEASSGSNVSSFDQSGMDSDKMQAMLRSWEMSKPKPKQTKRKEDTTERLPYSSY